ncbi:aminotransferase class V-fold PLP-dependent enzyme [Pedobacter sp. L105]|uniref:aminotransferase class V-fold PLP-dependent enzyme n=1 Tax=Pedobacter sp. L105 TaxID=1641871 RepID=UPI00131C3C4B|nr:aminotransferase class V-fold PLP-dependent enzyme [Pedobacter sp. L105]
MNFSDQFPVLDSYTYLNTASSGILFHSAADWRRKHDLEFMAAGSIFRLNQAQFLDEVRHNLSRFFHAKPENTFLVPNFSFGFNTFLDGLPGEHRFLLLHEEYPSINYPVQNRGFICDYAVIDEKLEENILEKIKLFKPTVLALSMVQYISGIQISFEFLKQLKRQFPELLIVADGTQFCGTSDFNFEASGLDVFIASGYKWMMGGYLNGFLFLKDEVAKLLYTGNQQSERTSASFLPYKNLLSSCFEPGHLDTLSFGTLNQGVLLMEKLGIKFIENQVQMLSKHAKAAFAERGLLDQAVVQRTMHSGIFNLSIDDKTYQKLQEENIICSARGKGIRVSFHFYNTVAELERLLEVIDSCV